MHTLTPPPSAPELEGASGLHLERRSLFFLPVAFPLGARWIGAPLRAADEEEARAKGREEGAFTPLTRAELGRRWQALALELEHAPPEHDESYAAQLAGLVARLSLADLPPLENPRGNRGFKAGLTWQLARAVAIEFQMEPGAELRLHNHPPQVVLSLCAEGEVRFRHFELEGEAPPCTEIDGTPFAVRATRTGLLRPRSSTSFTRTRDAIHGFVAGPRGARLVDFTLSLTPDIETFSYLELLPEPLAPDEGVHWARWLGKK
jgi:hypothetical protein